MLLEFPWRAYVQRTKKPKVGRRKGIGLPEGTHSDVLGRPVPDTGNFAKTVQEKVDVDNSLEADPSITDRLSECTDRGRPSLRQSDTGKVGVGEDFRRWKSMRQISRRQRLPEGSRNSSCKSRGPFNRDLLPENRPRCQLESIPTARNTHSRSSIQSRAQLTVAAECGRDTRPVSIYIEHRADSLHDEKESSRIAKLNPCDECVAALVERDLKVALTPI